MKKYKCPYCLHVFKSEEAERTMVKTMLVSYCPNKEEDPNTHKPVCGKRLPTFFFQSESKIISLTGGGNVGKTCFSVALLLQLMTNKSLWQLGISGEIIGEKRPKDLFFQLLRDIEEKKPLDTSLLGIEKEPMLLRIIINKNGKSGQVYLSLFDNFGEHFSDQDRIINDLHNIYNADGVLYVFEPIQISHLQEHVQKTHFIRSRVPADIHNTLHNVLEVIAEKKQSVYTSDRAARNITEYLWRKANELVNDKPDLPIGFVLSKIDQIEKMLDVPIPEGDSDLRIYSKDGVFDDRLINYISNNIERLITDRQEGDIRIKRIIDTCIDKYKFFGVQSINVNEHTGEPINMNSRGVVLPLIWLLKELGLY